MPFLFITTICDCDCHTAPITMKYCSRPSLVTSFQGASCHYFTCAANCPSKSQSFNVALCQVCVITPLAGNHTTSALAVFCIFTTASSLSAMQLLYVQLSLLYSKLFTPFVQPSGYNGLAMLGNYPQVSKLLRSLGLSVYLLSTCR